MLEFISIIVIIYLIYAVLKKIHNGVKNKRDNESSEYIANKQSKDQLEMLIRPQIDALASEGTPIHINHHTYVYFWALAACLSKNSIDALQIRELIKHFFPDVKYAFNIQNGYDVIIRSSDFLENLQDMLPVANNEVTTGKAEFLIKRSRKTNKEMKDLFEPDPDYDPRNVKRSDFLDV